MSDPSVSSGRVSLATAVAALADSLASATAPAEVYAAALHGIRHTLGVERASVLLFDDDGVMRFKAAHGLSEEYRRAVEGHSPWTQGQATPDPIVVSDATSDPALAALAPVLAREQIRALAFIPLVSQGRTLGKFMLYWPHVHSPSAFTLDAAQTIAALIGLAVSRARQNQVSREHEWRMQAALAQEAEARERLAGLAEGARRLQIPLDADRVTSEVLDMARHALRADGYAVWRRVNDEWRIQASHGLDPAFTAVTLAAPDRIVFDQPIVAEDVLGEAILDVRRQAYEAAGIRSLLSIPLSIRGRPGGSIAYYYRQRHRPTDLELRIAQALGHLAASAISSAELYSEQQALRQEAVRTSERASFLADVSGRLSPLEYEKNLEAIAQLVIPRFADWCAVDLIEYGDLRRLTVTHTDGARIELAHELHRRYPPRRDQPGPWRVVDTGVAELYEEITDDQLAQSARDADHLAMMRALAIRSALLVPLKRGAEVFGVLTLVLTNTDRRYTRADLEFAEELARRAAFAIENARLYQKAQEANRAKDEFLAALSHELRTPLNAILGWASILRAKPEGQIERGLDVIYRNAKVQAELVDDLLDASRIVSGRLSLDLKDAPLRPILEAAVETVLPSADEKEISVYADLPGPELLIRGDSARLQQVFWNILNNAVKFTPRGGRIALSFDSGADGVTVHVTDNGAGIRPESLPHIFDRFKQADSSSTRRYRGLGLGLTLARQLTEMHGGRIGAISPGAGLGATFSVTLPATDPHVVRVPKPPIATGTRVAGRRVLVVDDDPDSLEVLASLLRLHHAEVTAASSAAQALDLLHSAQPDVIISDIAMPEHDGFWLLQQIRRVTAEGGRRIPCVALTAFANPATRSRALGAGFAAHLSKPLDEDDLIRTVTQLLH